MENIFEASKLITNDDADKQIWIDDFYNKATILNSKFDQVQPESLYTAIMGSLDAPCSLFIEELPSRKVKTAGSYEEAVQYSKEYKKVVFYAKEFNKKTSIAMRFVVNLNALIIDIDNVRSHNIGIALGKIDSCPVKPNYIVNSGNGLHLFYVLKEKFDFMNYTCGMAVIRQVKRVVVTGGKIKKYKVVTANKIKDIYSAMLDWYEHDSYKIDKLHLAHGIRMFGGKTKNANILSIVYKCSDEMYDMDELAEITDVELFTVFEDKEFNRLNCINSDDIDDIDETDGYEEDIEEEEQEITSAPVTTPKPPRRTRAELEALFREIEEKFKQEQIKESKRSRPLVPKWIAYNYLVSKIKETFEVGRRNKSLFIMCCSGRLYQIPQEAVRKDLLEMAECMNQKNPEDMITPANIEQAFTGYFSRIKYTNDKITELIEIPFGKKQKEIRADVKLNRQEEELRLLELVEKEYSENPKISLRDLSDALKLQGISRGKTFLSTDSDVVKIRNKYTQIPIQVAA